MRRFFAFALVLACLAALAACGGEPGDAAAADADKPEPFPPFTGKNSTLQCVDGLYIALPIEYSELLLVDSEFPGAEESWKPLLSVYEKASYEAAMEEFGGGGGFLFGFLVMDQAAFEQHISTDGSGIDVFATDGERYYAYTHATDVQFFRSDAESLTDHPDWKTWEKLNEIGPLVREDFLTRNNLQSFSVQDFTDQLAAGDGNHVIMKYYSYFLKDGDIRLYDTLLLHQPARQGEGGIWAVERWLDEYGNQYLYFPDSGKPSAEHYADLQKACDAGELPELRTPAGAAAAFAKDFFGHETLEGSFEETREIDYAYMEMNQRLQSMILDVMYGTVDGMELLECLGSASADNWGVLGRYMYGSDWVGPLMEAVESAAVGEDQQARDRAVMSFFLATQDARTDFGTPLSGVLKKQQTADPDAFRAAAAELPEAERDVLFQRLDS